MSYRNQYSPQGLPNKWVSKGKTISKSAHHTELFIVEHGDGTFHSITSGHQTMINKYPPTKSKTSNGTKKS